MSQRRKPPLEWCVSLAVLFPVMPREEIELWLWEYVDERGKRRQTRYLLREENARARYGPSVKRVEGSREARTPLGHTSDWLKRSSRES